MNLLERRALVMTLSRDVMLGADLTFRQPDGPLVVFAHGSGSSRHSPRNVAVARALNRKGFGTLLLDLLTEGEDRAEHGGAQLRFDVDLLADRLVSATDRIDIFDDVAPTAIGYFGASTGAACALIAAALQGTRIGAVVSRGGRPDMAGPMLGDVDCPTLLIVAERDPEVLALNERALTRMRCLRHLEVIPEATHLFEEPGAMDCVIELASSWFAHYLGPVTRP